MTLRDELLNALAPSNVFQPATMLWRVFEIEAVLRQGLPAGTGVDIGCGDGELGRVLLDRLTPRPSVIGIEPDPADAGLARRSGTYVAVHTTDGAKLPLADASLDFAFSNSTLEHIRELDPVLAETARVVRPGGAFIFTVPSDEFHACLRGHPLIAIAAAVRGIPYARRVDERLAHHRYPAPDAWRRLLAAHHFALVRAERYFPQPAVRAWEGLSSLTGGLAFELRGGRPTRAIQHDLRLDRRSVRLAGGAAWIARKYAGRAFDAGVRPGEPSGGLLVVARRVAA